MSESDYYRLVTVPLPEDLVLEVGGMELLPGGNLAIATRRGEVWIAEDPYTDGEDQPYFSRFAHGLHEPLGLLYRDEALYTAQRGELTRLSDEDGDGRADRYRTVYSWPISGNYHEYSYGPVRLPNGNFWVNLNLGHAPEYDPFIGEMASLAPWRGWALEITPDGEMTPLAAGLRSPNGLALNPDGEMFYSAQQGGWIGSGRITHLERGDFLGHPAGLRWSGDPRSPLDIEPEDIPDTGRPIHEVAREVPELKLPSVWLPQHRMGISTSDIIADTTGGRFGPFEGQLLVGDQGLSRINRVFLEKVDGVYQGAAFPFLSGFISGVNRLTWGRDGSLFVGMTDRGWAAEGTAPFGLQRVVWTDSIPFEIEEMRARSDGFDLLFTRPVNPEAASDTASYRMESFAYRYDHEYGSPEIDRRRCPVEEVEVLDGGRRVRLRVGDLRPGYVHALEITGTFVSEDEVSLLHREAYYTLNRIPEAGEPASERPNHSSE